MSFPADRAAAHFTSSDRELTDRTATLIARERKFELCIEIIVVPKARVDHRKLKGWPMRVVVVVTLEQIYTGGICL